MQNATGKWNWNSLPFPDLTNMVKSGKMTVHRNPLLNLIPHFQLMILRLHIYVFFMSFKQFFWVNNTVLIRSGFLLLFSSL